MTWLYIAPGMTIKTFEPDLSIPAGAAPGPDGSLVKYGSSFVSACVRSLAAGGVIAIEGIVVGIVVGGALELVQPPIATADIMINPAEIFTLRIRYSFKG